MATFSAPDLNSKAMPMGTYGNAAVVYGTATPLSGVVGSIYRPVRIPAGMSVTALRIVNDDLDTGGTTFAVKIGYTPVDSGQGPVEDDDYFFRCYNDFIWDGSYRPEISTHQIRKRCLRYPDCNRTGHCICFGQYHCNRHGRGDRHQVKASSNQEVKGDTQGLWESPFY